MERSTADYMGRALKTPEDIAAADDHADLGAKLVNRFHLLGDPRDRRGVEAVALVSHQCFAGYLQKNLLPTHSAGTIGVR